LFSYLPEKFRFTIRLGQFISHNIVKPHKRVGDPLPPQELNKLNREELALNAYRDMPADLLVGEYNKELLLREMAIYIDKRIPQSYVKWKYRDHEKGPSGTAANAKKHGLIYHFDDDGNYFHEDILAERLGSLRFSKDPIVKGFEADMRKSTEKVITTKKQIKKETEISTETAKQIGDSNYTQLTSYLKDKNVHVDRVLFKAILFAMNGMTTYYQTKQSAIKKASERFDVTQASVKKHIDAMGILSERASQNGKTNKQYSGKEAIINHVFQRRLEREENE